MATSVDPVSSVDVVVTRPTLRNLITSGDAESAKQCGKITLIVVVTILTVSLAMWMLYCVLSARKARRDARNWDGTF